MTDLHKRPWEKIAADFCGDLPTGEKLLVIIDLYSKMPIVEFMKSTKFQSVAERLDALFSLFGYPELMKTDNGPPWDSNDFEHYLKVRNFMHESSIPLWPRSNGQVKQFMQILGKTIRHNIECETNTWKNSIHTMLLNYSKSINPATNETPAKLFFWRETNYGIPYYDNVKDPSFDKVNLHHQQYNAKAKRTLIKFERIAP